MNSTPIPTSYVYFYMDGRLQSSPRYGPNDGGNAPLPSNYAQFYPEKIGGITSKDIKAKIFLHVNGNTEVKEFTSSHYGNSPKILRKVVEQYITTQLKPQAQQQLPISRKKTKSKSKIKRCKCK